MLLEGVKPKSVAMQVGWSSVEFMLEYYVRFLPGWGDNGVMYSRHSLECLVRSPGKWLQRSTRWGPVRSGTPSLAGHHHGYGGQLFYLGLALDAAYVEGLVEGCLERIDEDEPEEERLFRAHFEDKAQRDVMIESLKVDCEVRVSRTPW